MLLPIAGKPLILHTVERANEAATISRVIVATDDVRIFDVVTGSGNEAVMTSTEHRSGSDRVAEVARGLPEGTFVVNVQGDEPLIPPPAINQVAQNLRDNPEAGIASLYAIVRGTEEINNPNAVKVVCDAHGFALYFSRSTIPHGSSAQARNCQRHIGIYAYRVSTLRQFVSCPPGQLEIQEKLEQLRALYNGIRIHMAESCERVPAGVDTERDLENVRALLAGQH
jgi:3-deoxy-manno-octulosonate cytidylyltransferase (CMP-KDO synthetase)